jgi:hypothetical protein
MLCTITITHQTKQDLRRSKHYIIRLLSLGN